MFGWTIVDCAISSFATDERIDAGISLTATHSPVVVCRAERTTPCEPVPSSPSSESANWYFPSGV